WSACFSWADGTFDPSVETDSADPGHFLNWPKRASLVNSSPRLASGMNEGTAGFERSKRFTMMYARPAPPSASFGPVVEKSSNQLKSSGVEGRRNGIVGGASLSALL